MPEQVECKNCVHKTHWFEKADNGEWFICFTKRIHGKNQVIKLAVSEINEKVKEAQLNASVEI